MSLYKTGSKSGPYIFWKIPAKLFDFGSVEISKRLPRSRYGTFGRRFSIDGFSSLSVPTPKIRGDPDGGHLS